MIDPNSYFPPRMPSRPTGPADERRRRYSIEHLAGGCILIWLAVNPTDGAGERRTTDGETRPK